jgi:CubicO group peptidase (beta-lactamase class C family)
MTEDTIFDLASLTKVVATTPAIMILVEQGRIKLDAPVASYIPQFTGGGKEKVTVRQLLTHTSGLRAGIDSHGEWQGWDAAIEKICRERLLNPPGEVFRYSDLNFILLGEMVQRLTGGPLQEFVAREIYRPLRMTDTGFVPPAAQAGRIAPTEVMDGRLLRGVVDDPTARRMGGVAGNAGVFATAADLARFARMLLNQGALDGAEIFKPETVRLMTTVQTPASLEAQRGLGWDIDSEYSGPRGDLFSGSSYGHTGWTGTSIWIDPASRTFIIFLSNRNYPDDTGNVVALRHQLGTLAAEAADLKPAH